MSIIDSKLSYTDMLSPKHTAKLVKYLTLTDSRHIFNPLGKGNFIVS